MSEKRNLAFSKKERNGILILLIILLSSYAYNIFLEPKFTSNQKYVSIDDIVKIQEDSIEYKRIKSELSSFVKNEKITKSTLEPIEVQTDVIQTKINKPNLPLLTSFDPNTIDSSSWIKLGLDAKVIRTIFKYKSKGGKFYTCNDLSKIYGLDKTIIEKLLPYCSIPITNKTYISKTAKKVFSKQKIDINLADSVELKKLYGVGPKLSKRIIKYRDAIGGFHNLDQLLEVYGIEKDILIDNKNRLSCNGPIKKIRINELDKQDLAYHAFFNFKQAKIIVNYRNQHGSFKTKEELKNVIVINDSIYNKIEPYISVE